MDFFHLYHLLYCVLESLFVIYNSDIGVVCDVVIYVNI
jgi:hypothetical protein